MIATQADWIPDEAVYAFLLVPVILIIAAIWGLCLIVRGRDRSSETPEHSTLHDQIQFLAAIDKLKHVLRQSPVSGLSRKENSAEHSWHVAMYAAVLGGSIRPEADLGRVLKMLLIHDIVEIEAGDTPLHGDQSNRERQAERELEAAQNLFGLLPEPQGNEFLELWREFERGETAEAKLSKALDRLQPVIQNINNGGGTWTDNEVTREQVYERCGPEIESGSPELWDYVKTLIETHFLNPLPNHESISNGRKPHEQAGLTSRN